MLTVSKNDGAKSKTGDEVKKGSKGRLELYAERLSDGSLRVTFKDYGNYGKERWTADFGMVTEQQLADMVDALVALQNNQTNSTHVPFEQTTQGQAQQVEEQIVPPQESLAEESSQEASV